MLTLRHAMVPLVRSCRVLHPAQYYLLNNHHGDRKEKAKKKRYPSCLAHAVIGMFYSVIAKQCQPQYTYNVYGVGANRDQLLHIYCKGGRGVRG